MNPITRFLKAFITWANSRTLEQKLWWLAFLAVAVVAAFSYAPIGLAYFTVLIVLMFIAVVRHKRLLPLVLIVALFLPVPRVRSQQTKVQECSAIVIGGAVIVVGGIVIWQMVKFCKKHFPPPAPATPPPPAGTNNPSTNGSSANLKFAMSPSAQVESYDCSTTGWMDNSLPTNPVPYQDFITLHFSGSTNLVDWTNCFAVNMWLSSNSMVSVVYDPSMKPVSTNRALGNPYTSKLTNSLDFPLFNRSQPQLFLRDY